MTEVTKGYEGQTPEAKEGDCAIAASLIFSRLADDIGDGALTVGAFLDRIDARAPGLLLLILALPMCVPNVPGISTLFGLLLIVPAVQLMVGGSSGWLPGPIRRLTVSGRILTGALRIAVPLLRRAEYFTRPRLTWMMRCPVTSLIGFQALIMALVLILPLWGANLIPGLAVSMSGLAILQRDGVLALLSAPVAMAALAWVYFGTKYAVSFLAWLAEWGSTIVQGVF